MKPGDPVTVWVGDDNIGMMLRGCIYGGGEVVSGETFQQHMADRVKNSLSRLYEWRSVAGAVRLIDERDLGVVWLPGWSDEIERAIRAARALV